MKLVITVVEDNDVAFLMEAWSKAATKQPNCVPAASCSGKHHFAHRVQDTVEPVLEIIRTTCAPARSSMTGPERVWACLWK